MSTGKEELRDKKAVDWVWRTTKHTESGSLVKSLEPGAGLCAAEALPSEDGPTVIYSTLTSLIKAPIFFSLRLDNPLVPPYHSDTT